MAFRMLAAVANRAAGNKEIAQVPRQSKEVQSGQQQRLTDDLFITASRERQPTKLQPAKVHRPRDALKLPKELDGSLPDQKMKNEAHRNSGEHAHCNLLCGVIPSSNASEQHWDSDCKDKR